MQYYNYEPVGMCCRYGLYGCVASASELPSNVNHACLEAAWSL
jgi:hypothetical protein